MPTCSCGAVFAVKSIGKAVYHCHSCKNEWAPVSAFYDLSLSPHSYDFLTFLVISRAHGCNHTVFVPGEKAYQKCSPEEMQFRLDHLLIPLAKMSGDYTVCKSREEAREFEPTFPVGYTVDTPKHSHMLGKLLAGGRASWLEAPDLDVPRGKVTITIRESRIKPLRNSNIGEWIKAAEQIEEMGYSVLFVPDTDNMQEFGRFESYPQASLDPAVRLALYSKSVLNLGINNGPMAMCMYSRMPYIVFMRCDEAFDETSSHFFNRNGFPKGSQFPWRKDRQLLVWEQDKAESIVNHVKQWEGRKAA